MAETLIIIQAEHNVPINLADHFTKLVSNKLVFPDSVFLRSCSARTLLAKSSHRARCHYLFFQKLNMSGTDAVCHQLFDSEGVFKVVFW